MNTQKSSKKTVITIIIIVAISLIAYFYYQGMTPVSSVSLETTQATTDAQVAGSRVLGLLNQIRSLKIDTSVLQDQVYMSLKDYSVPIPQENVGRQNPFAPLPGSIIPTQASTTNSKPGPGR